MLAMQLIAGEFNMNVSLPTALEDYVRRKIESRLDNHYQLSCQRGVLELCKSETECKKLFKNINRILWQTIRKVLLCRKFC